MAQESKTPLDLDAIQERIAEMKVWHADPEQIAAFAQRQMLRDAEALLAAVTAQRAAPQPRVGDIIEAAYFLEQELREHLPSFPDGIPALRHVFEKHLGQAMLRAASPEQEQS